MVSKATGAQTTAPRRRSAATAANPAIVRWWKGEVPWQCSSAEAMFASVLSSARPIAHTPSDSTASNGPAANGEPAVGPLEGRSGLEGVIDAASPAAQPVATRPFPPPPPSWVLPSSFSFPLAWLAVAAGFARGLGLGSLNAKRSTTWSTRLGGGRAARRYDRRHLSRARCRWLSRSTSSSLLPSGVDASEELDCEELDCEAPADSLEPSADLPGAAARSASR
mmetsp:Transcript_41602/g.93872  ORF Transcript_41602/g.93872 Transcript_41602/m.93872 type:complete len:223 (+) Transcript_41602:104-772(+)